MKDRDVIDAFVIYLQGHGYPYLQVENRPDTINRNSSDIDAIAGNLAIEHTSIDTLPAQRTKSDWFRQVVDGIEKEILGRIPFRLKIYLEYNAVAKGQDWAAIRNAIKNWIINESLGLADGHHVLDNVTGVPFQFHITKESDRPPHILFGRLVLSDDTLLARIKEQFDRKMGKLAKYHPHKTTILLVESDDFALMSKWKVLDAIRKAYTDGIPPGVDYIWYADTSIFSDIEFECLSNGSNGTRLG